MQFDPKATREYIDHMVDLEAVRKAKESCNVLITLEEQGKLEYAMLVASSKIAILEDMLKEQRSILIARSTEVAKNRDKLIMLLNNVPSQGDKNG